MKDVLDIRKRICGLTPEPKVRNYHIIWLAHARYAASGVVNLSDIRKRIAGMVIHHPYGCYGNNRNYYQIITEEEHRAFYSIYWYKTNGGQFVRNNPNMHNYWKMMFNLLGI